MKVSTDVNHDNCVENPLTVSFYDVHIIFYNILQYDNIKCILMKSLIQCFICQWVDVEYLKLSALNHVCVS